MSAFPQEAYDHERPSDVFDDLVATLPEEQRAEWQNRYAGAERAAATMRGYNRAYSETLMTVTRSGQ